MSRTTGTTTHMDQIGGLGELRDQVIVGVDGSAGSQLALDWAMAKADRLGPVVPVATYHIDSLVDGVGSVSIYDDMIDILRQDAEARVETSTKGHPEVTARGRIVRGYPGPALVRIAEGQKLLVVGSRGRSALAETVLGSVASYCVKHTTVPVAVIPRGSQTDQPLKHLVVGVDGSPNSDAALAWAARHVEPGGTITAVTCRVPAPYALELVPPPPLPYSELQTVASQAVDQAIATVGKVDAEFETKVVDGDPRVTLRDAAAEADLLVVGSRGHRGVAYWLLGSVTSSLIHHPTVPTVVVPAA